MFSLLKRLDLKTFIPQIMLVWLLLPFVAVAIENFAPQTTGTFITSVLGEIKVIEHGADFFENYSNAKSINMLDYFSTLIDVASKNMMEMTLVGLCVYNSRRLFSLVGIKGISAVQTVIGVCVACLCLGSIKTESDYFYILGVLLVITALVVIFVVKGHFFKWLWDFSLGTGMAIITATFISGFLSVIMVIFRGGFPSLLDAISASLQTLFPVVLCLFIDIVFFGKVKTD